MKTTTINDNDDDDNVDDNDNVTADADEAHLCLGIVNCAAHLVPAPVAVTTFQRKKLRSAR